MSTRNKNPFSRFYGSKNVYKQQMKNFCQINSNFLILRLCIWCFLWNVTFIQVEDFLFDSQNKIWYFEINSTFSKSYVY